MFLNLKLICPYASRHTHYFHTGGDVARIHGASTSDGSSAYAYALEYVRTCADKRPIIKNYTSETVGAGHDRNKRSHPDIMAHHRVQVDDHEFAQAHIGSD